MRVLRILLLPATAFLSFGTAPAFTQPVRQSPAPQSDMTEANKALVRRFFRAMESGDFAARNAVVDPAGVMHALDGDRAMGTARTSIAEVCQMCAALPDLRIRIDLLVAEADLVTVRSTWTGTYSGTYRGMTIATPRPVTVRYVNIYRIANGRIVENWASMDRLALAEQLGFTLAPGHAPSP